MGKQLAWTHFTCNLCGLLLLLLSATMLHARRLHSRRLIIHVPVRVKTHHHHHTHTVYKVLHGAGGGGGGGGNGGIKQTVYKVLGYSQHAGNNMASSVGHDHGHMHGHGEVSYEDMHGCESGKLMPGHRDMIFNHYNRQDETDYPMEEDEFIDVSDISDAWA